MLTAVMLMPLAMLLAPLASSRPRTSPPVMHLDVVDALTPIVAMVQPREFEFDSLPLSPLDVLRDFLGPIVVSINNDPLWQFALVVGMVGSWVTIAQTRATVAQITGRRRRLPLPSWTRPHSTWRSSGRSLSWFWCRLSSSRTPSAASSKERVRAWVAQKTPKTAKIQAAGT